MNKKTAEIEQTTFPEVTRRWKDTHIALDYIIGYWIKVIEAIKLTAHSHVENFEFVKLDFIKIAPDQKVVI